MLALYLMNQNWGSRTQQILIEWYLAVRQSGICDHGYSGIRVVLAGGDA